MDPGLLRLYNEELAYLRETGAEFAREFPKVAGRLSMDGVEVADPYVERLLEGFAFLAARTQLKIDAQYPRFISHLLETVYPNFLTPVPSMAIVRLQPDLGDPNLVKGFGVPRGSTVGSTVSRGQGTHCTFRTAHDLKLWPLEITQVQYVSHAPDLPLAQLPVARQVKGALRIRLRLHGGIGFQQLPMDSLPFHISAPDDVALRLHELVLGASLGSWVPQAGAPARAQWADAPSVQPVGLDDEHALLPSGDRGFSGHRLLQEFAAMPQRLLFFELTDLRARLARVKGPEAELVLLFSRGDAALESLVDASSLALFCTPVVNLFPKRLDRIVVSPGEWEHHVVPDRTRPMDFEVHHIESLTGYGNGRVAEQRFLPLYTAFHTEGLSHPAYFTLRRAHRQLSERQRRQGPRTAYIGSEAFVSLVDPLNAPYREDLRQLSVSAWVSNRDLPVLLPGASQQASADAPLWTLDAPGPVTRVDGLRGPTRPVQRLPRGDVGWSLISLLQTNHLALAGEDPHKAAAALRSVLQLFGPQQDSAWRKLVEGVLSVQARMVTRRLPFKGPLTFGTGVDVAVEVDELAFQGSSAFMLGSVLERFFARHAVINSFTQTGLSSVSRGAIHRWAPRCGNAPLL